MHLDANGEVYESSSNSLDVAAPIAIVFMVTIIATVTDRAQELSSLMLVQQDLMIR